MAAIDIHIGTQAPEDRQDSSCTINGLGEAARACIPPIEQMHVSQTRMIWVRRALTDWVRDHNVEVRLVTKGKDVGFEISKPFVNTDFQWFLDKSSGQTFFGLIGEAAKMGCPTWDLPAGSPVLGGSCPAATAGQSTVPLQIRKKAEPRVGEPVRLREAICEICYAEGGNYATFTIQLGELLRYWWTRQLIDGGRTDEWVATMVDAIRRSSFPEERLIDPRTGKPILPMRVHSSGDFYAYDYAKAWIQVVNQLPDITFWAPTRTWAAGNWVEFWGKYLPTAEHGNLILRPSAYHTDDPAIAAGVRMVQCHVGGLPEYGDSATVARPQQPWAGAYPFNSTGTTAVYKFNDLNALGGRTNEEIAAGAPSLDPRYDWPCAAYAVMDDAKSCRNALAPDGEVGCRACWIRPDLRVNYTAH